MAMMTISPLVTDHGGDYEMLRGPTVRQSRPAGTRCAPATGWPDPVLGGGRA
jgi:hypothetical protein